MCPECRAVHHADCLAKAGGCATFGCARGVQPSPRPARRGRAWSYAATALVAAGVAWIGAKLHEPPPPPPPPVVRRAPPPAPPAAPVVRERRPRGPVVLHDNCVLGVPEAVSPPRFLDASARAHGGEVILSGRLEGRGPMKVEVATRGGQRIAWEAQEPGPFRAAVTLRAGASLVAVQITDAYGVEGRVGLRVTR
jgi:hypothetical protein